MVCEFAHFSFSIFYDTYVLARDQPFVISLIFNRQLREIVVVHHISCFFDRLVGFYGDYVLCDELFCVLGVVSFLHGSVDGSDVLVIGYVVFPFQFSY